MKKQIILNDARKELIRRKVVEYFAVERDESLGELASQLILDFFIEEIGPEIYNQGVEDSHTYMINSLDDLFALQIKRK